MSTSIFFLLPGSGKKPAGGYKVVYEYANRLVQDGYDVSIAYASSMFFCQASLCEKLKTILRYFYYKLFGVSCHRWFSLNEKIREIVVLSLNQRHIGSADFYVATSVETAEYLSHYKEDNKKKLYLIQDYENWNHSDNFVLNTYSYGFKNIVISKWLKRILDSHGWGSTFIPNGFDFEYFKLKNAIDERNPYSISMLYHKDRRKGCEYGIRALELLKSKYPQLEVSLFGVPAKPDKLPKWIVYYQMPNRENHNNIYNKSAIFIAPSLSEGWGLTVGEAMICGACIVCSDADGFKEMIENEKNGLICDKGSVESIVEAVDRLLNDNNLRIKLAQNGNKTIMNFTWGNSYKKFKSLLS